ncbi:hypothetical protein N9X61_01755 [Sulfurimonas sp.]|nr:hypothetical protein [Sulfurimonas sp.]
MCISSGTGSKSNGFEKEDKPKKHIYRVSKSEFEKGDPSFVDERIRGYLPKKKESLFSSIFE